MPVKNKKNDNDLLGAFEEDFEKETGIVEEIEESDPGDLDEDIDINRTEKISVPVNTDRGLNADDLIDNIPEEAEEPEPEISVNTEESFKPSKTFDKKKKVMQGAVIITAALMLLAIIIVPEFKKNKKVKETAVISETDKIIEEMKEYSADDLKKKREREAREETAEIPIKKDEDEKNESVKKSGTGGRKHTQGTGECSGPNCMKDKEILDKYASVNPDAASGGMAGGSGGLMNIPARQGTKGGLNILGKSAGEAKAKAKYYNLTIKAALQFGVRSSGGSNVVAVLKESKGDFPEGTVFYGTATFSNKRTYVNFSHAIVNDEKIPLEGKAMQGADPGIPSEVTEIAADNANSSLKSGALGAVGKVADNALSRVTAGATEGVLSEPTSDLQKQEEKEKKQFEYFVPAKTTFTIYIY
ncbi:MAG TPA: hypothetical protein PLZ43_15930 [bacterium]|nr:hypothetical protein [bacterium]